MIIYSLYKKTHNVTGLQYLGFTKRDPHKYSGSGKIWRLHLKKHGDDVTTEILLQTPDKSEIKKTGVYYSELWNIVESNDWANLKPEEGDGGMTVTSEELSSRALKKWSEKQHRQKMKAIHSSPEFKAKISKISKEWCNSPEGKETKSRSRKALWQTEEFSEKMLALFKSDEWRAKLSKAAKKNSNRPEEKERRRLKALAERKNDPIFFCDACQISVKGHPAWGTHKKSKRHQAMICD